jgi:hypothetical protein
MGGLGVTETWHIRVVERFADVLDSLGIAYAIGGSVASSAYGTRRFTQDADITVEPFSGVAHEFYQAVKGEFYISEEAMREALKSFGSFNVIHFETVVKIDIFVQGPSEFEQQLLARSRRFRPGDTGRSDLSVVSPEDIILLKLRWFGETGCTSERQWGDVLGVLGVQGEALDFTYLTEWAGKLGLSELLGRARMEAET